MNPSHVCGIPPSAPRLAVIAGARPVVAARRARGLTLVELLVTMVVAAILVAYAVPSMETFISNNQLATSANDLVAGLNLARSEAVRTSQPVGVCFTATGSWVVAPVVAAGTSCDGTAVVRAGSLPASQLSLLVASPINNLVSFDALGRLVTTGGSNFASLMICRNGVAAVGAQSTSRAVLVSASGRIRVAPTDPTSQMPVEIDQLNSPTLSNCAATT